VPDSRPRFEPLPGLRVVAEPEALDRASWVGDDVVVLRLAPDDALGLGARSVELPDEHAIIESEAGFVAAHLALDDIARHIEWVLPRERPALAQGSVAGVPARLWLTGDDEDALLLTTAAYADELAGRLR
jgi:hypothetical protein